MDHFPLGYLVMGKNVFSWINDMFFKKEVTTLSEALPVPNLPRHSSKKRATREVPEQQKEKKIKIKKKKEVLYNDSKSHPACGSVILQYFIEYI